MTAQDLLEEIDYQTFKLLKIIKDVKKIMFAAAVR
jgi:hypothetical protein